MARGHDQLMMVMVIMAEAWSNVSDADMERLKQVSTAALRALVDGHSKCSKAFYYLEFGVSMVRHIVMVRRFMYHHHICRTLEGPAMQRLFRSRL